MAATEAVSPDVSKCSACQLLFKACSRSLCASCLNRNLQRACQKTAVLSPGTPRISPGTPRTFFPGMPRAVLGPVNREKGHHISAPHSRVLLPVNRASNRTPEGDVLSRSGAPKDSRSPAVERADEKDTHFSSVASGEQEKVVRLVDSKSSATEQRGTNVAVVDKWHLFQIQKNLTVRIPNPPTETSMHPDRLPQLVVPSKKHSYNLVPARKEAIPRNQIRPSRVKKWTIKPDASAEAELMRRLLADSIPILKSTAPLELPPCKIRPAPISPLSPPGDPLWKRRCIPCPESLKLQVAALCVS